MVLQAPTKAATKGLELCQAAAQGQYWEVLKLLQHGADTTQADTQVSSINLCR